MNVIVHVSYKYALFCILFQAHRAFHYVVIDANARQCLWIRNGKIVSKTEILVKKIKHQVFLHNSLLHYLT